MINTAEINKTRSSKPIASTVSPSINAHLPTSPQFPIFLQGLSEEGAEQAKKNWQVMQSAVEKLTEQVQSSCTAASKESFEYGMKVLGTAMSHAQSALELSTALLQARTPAELVKTTTTHARQQMEAVAAQNRELWSAAQKILTSALRPLKDEK
jgi:hypothetical protein